ncbi:hypothetical protein LTS15_011276 [Exophiala xenobiotica]|nr:hypothetical protein LTS15_011276 [Exophiala xenobiotica]
MALIPVCIARTGGIVGTYVAPSFASLIAAATVGSVPAIKDYLTTESFIKDSFVNAASQLADVAIPTWLVVLGGRAARCGPTPLTFAPSGELRDDPSTVILISLLARMLLPVISMSALLALFSGNKLVFVFNDPLIPASQHLSSRLTSGVRVGGDFGTKESVPQLDASNRTPGVDGWTLTIYRMVMYFFVLLVIAVGFTPLASPAMVARGISSRRQRSQKAVWTGQTYSPLQGAIPFHHRDIRPSNDSNLDHFSFAPRMSTEEAPYSSN